MAEPQQREPTPLDHEDDYRKNKQREYEQQEAVYKAKIEEERKKEEQRIREFEQAERMQKLVQKTSVSQPRKERQRSVELGQENQHDKNVVYKSVFEEQHGKGAISVGLVPVVVVTMMIVIAFLIIKNGFTSSIIVIAYVLFGLGSLIVVNAGLVAVLLGDVIIISFTLLWILATFLVSIVGLIAYR